MDRLSRDDALGFDEMSGEPLQIPPPGFEDLSIDEQLEYVERLWDHIAAHPERVPVPDWHHRIIQERLKSDSSSLMQHVVPALRIRSYEASKAFYEKLGFEEQRKHQFETGLPVFASISRDGMEIFLTEHTGDCQFGGLVHFYVANVDESYSQFLQRGVPVKEPPSNSLGPDIRDMLVVDPDGNRLSFLTRSAEATK